MFEWANEQEIFLCCIPRTCFIASGNSACQARFEVLPPMRLPNGKKKGMLLAFPFSGAAGFSALRRQPLRLCLLSESQPAQFFPAAARARVQGQIPAPDLSI